LIVSAHDDVVM